MYLVRLCTISYQSEVRMYNIMNVRIKQSAKLVAPLKVKDGTTNPHSRWHHRWAKFIQQIITRTFIHRNECRYSNVHLIPHEEVMKYFATTLVHQVPCHYQLDVFHLQRLGHLSPTVAVVWCQSGTSAWNISESWRRLPRTVRWLSRLWPRPRCDQRYI